jgi:hypothetical protein
VSATAQSTWADRILSTPHTSPALSEQCRQLKTERSVVLTTAKPGLLGEEQRVLERMRACLSSSSIKEPSLSKWGEKQPRRGRCRAKALKHLSRVRKAHRAGTEMGTGQG